ncbi:MAG TPA: zinc-binding dehydrogenase [Candidatus Dormibacteraeota bacterium]|nr:zinc-binding dehydrogenase [Candidatus Dormibacteraeota bacterium]
MKALAFHEHGGLDKLKYQDVPDPKIGDGDVLVRVRAAALNHLDLFVREGLPGLTLPMPFWTGCDIAGEVAQVGAAVADVTVGERVAVNPNLYDGRCEYCLRGEHSLCVRYGILGEHTHGGLAEYVRVQGHHVTALPDAITYEDAAAFILVNMTAWRMLVTQARLRAGEDLLILGVGGGVSSAAVQIGKLCGARVWVTSSSDDKLERARALGADECINYAKEDWVKVIGQKTRRRGVDVVLENVGAATWKGSIRAVAKGGRIVTCGATSGPIGETDIRQVFWKQLSIIGSTMSNDAEFNAVMGQLFAGRLRAIVDAVMPLREGAEAERRLAEGRQFGKIVLVP